MAEVKISYGGSQKGLPLIAATTKVGNKTLKGIGLDEATALKALEDEVLKENFRLRVKAGLPKTIEVDFGTTQAESVGDPEEIKVGGTD